MSEEASQASPRGKSDPERVEWVDYAKGVCIFFVVMLHASRYVQFGAGRECWIQVVVDFARPFRMPDFFLISGLFLARVIDRPWRSYLDSKVAHFAYFYVLWLAIVCLTLPFMSGPRGHAHHGAVATFLLELVQPTTSLWFIHMLPIFFVVTKLLRPVPWPLVWGVAAGLQVAVIDTGVNVVDEGTERFVYFFTGYALAPQVFAFGRWVMDRPRVGLLGLLVWAVTNGLLVHRGVAAAPGISLFLGGAGALAVISASALLSRTDVMGPVRYCGQNSLIVYLAYFLPMKAMKKLIFDTGAVGALDLGLVVLLATLAGVVAPLVLHRMVRGGPLRWLFERPAWARVGTKSTAPSAIGRASRPVAVVGTPSG